MLQLVEVWSRFQEIQDPRSRRPPVCLEEELEQVERVFGTSTGLGPRRALEPNRATLFAWG